MQDLIERWASGDPAAAEELYRRYYARVREFAVKRGLPLADADDVAQDALLAGLDGLKEGKRPRRLTGWLLGIARHLSFRRRRPRPEEDMESLARTPSGARTELVRREMRELLARTLQQLSPGQREVLELVHKEGLSRKEAAARLNLSMVTVHARCERAYARLRSALAGHFTTLVAPRPERRAPTLADILKLRPAFREAVVARHLEGLSDVEAATRLGIPEATLEARLEGAYELLGCSESTDWSEARKQWRAGKTG
jgi:RNA polymerase sigma-70 factor (ECF subfamily)